jgi:hypothetical protein
MNKSSLQAPRLHFSRPLKLLTLSVLVKSHFRQISRRVFVSHSMSSTALGLRNLSLAWYVHQDIQDKLIFLQFLHWVKLQPEVSGQSLPGTPLIIYPSVFIEKEIALNDHIPETTRAALSNQTVRYPTVGVATRPMTPNLSYPRQLSRRMTLPPSYPEAVPAYGVLLSVRNWKWIVNPIGIGLSLLGDFFCARLFLRWVVAIGIWYNGPTLTWLSPKSLALFWAADSLVFRKLGIMYAVWMLGLYFIESWPGRYSTGTASFIELFLALLFYIVGGVIRALVLAADAAATM